jgi:hypothetical protein
VPSSRAVGFRLRAVNGRRLPRRFRLLRNSTIFRCAKNWDSDSARREPLKRRGSLSCGPIVHSAQSEPNRPLTRRNSITGFFVKRRSMPVGAPEKIGPRLAHSPHSGAFCEDCTSPNFCAAKIVEFRSSRMRGMRCGLFGRPDRHRPGSEANNSQFAFSFSLPALAVSRKPETAYKSPAPCA